MCSTSSRVFLSLRQRRGIGDALAALLTRKGIDDEMGRADQTFIHGGGGLAGHELLPQRFVSTAAKLAQRLGEPKVRWRGIARIRSQATGVHHGNVRAQALTERFIRGAPCMLEHLQSQQDADGHGPSATPGACGETFLNTVLDGAHQSRPGKGIGPATNGMCIRNKVCHLQGCSGAAQPMLKGANKAHRGLS